MTDTGDSSLRGALDAMDSSDTAVATFPSPAGDAPKKQPARKYGTRFPPSRSVMPRPALLNAAAVGHWLEQRRAQRVRAEMAKQEDVPGIKRFFPPLDPDPYRHKQIGEIEDLISKMNKFPKRKRRHRKRKLTTKPTEEAADGGPVNVPTGVLTPDSISEVAEEEVPSTAAEGTSGSKRPEERRAAKLGEAGAKSSKTAQIAKVQTTLSLGSKPGFVECKECNTVYNPLNRKDVKHHNKRHTLVGRKQAKAIP